MLIPTLTNKLLKNKNCGLSRERFLIENRDSDTILVNSRSLINFSSNDYLATSTHPKVKKAFIEGIERYGAGSGSSALISAFYTPHQVLEEKLAEFLHRDRAILFNSGYLANLGVMTTFANRHTTIISDKFCHASILDGVALSRAKHDRYHHNNTHHCEALLSKRQQNCLLITEGVFSMAGDISPTDKLAVLAKRYLATLIVDDAHGIGVLGNNGGGICEHYQLNQDDIPCLITPLGKAFGSTGAVVSGNKSLIDGLIQFARTYRYTTALPPAISLATIESLNIISKEPWRREKLQNLISIFILEAKSRRLPIVSDDPTPIKSILVGSNETALKVKKNLMQQGFFVSCIRPPSVPTGTARIRISLNCLHKEKDIIRLLDLLAKFHE
jgi:8-amino-7-oxononanoate synthase